MVCRIAFVCVFTAVSFSCIRPGSEEKFIKARNMSADSAYVFPADMSYDDCLYDVYLYTVIERDTISIGRVPFSVTWISPSGEIYREKVYMRESDKVHDSFSGRQYKALYRTGLKPSEYGLWSVRIKTGFAVPGMLGVGLMVKDVH
jgi:hypothetical protein